MSQVLAAVLHRRESPPTEYSVLIRILTNQAVPNLSLASYTHLPRVNHPRLLAWLKEERLGLQCWLLLWMWGHPQTRVYLTQEKSESSSNQQKSQITRGPPQGHMSGGKESLPETLQDTFRGQRYRLSQSYTRKAKSHMSEILFRNGLQWREKPVGKKDGMVSS